MSRMDDLMYQAGLTAQGCWDQMDEYNRAAVTKFGELVLAECIAAIDKTNTHHAYTTFDQDMILATIKKSKIAMREHFGVE